LKKNIKTWRKISQYIRNIAIYNKYRDILKKFDIFSMTQYDMICRYRKRYIESSLVSDNTA